MNDQLTGLISIQELLLHSKALEPLPETALAELVRIERLTELQRFSEADVREEIVTPIIRALGYDKGSIFSIEREKKLDFLDKRRFIDYSVTIFQENFWLIEAKRPNLKNAAFGYDDLWQAVEYAVHPEVNAALVVICDGQKLEVFDREESVTSPILHIARQHLVRDFDQLRALLSPWQAWFFQKRRIVRLIDKVFDRELNLNRVDEFKWLIERHLANKRIQVLTNYRALFDFQMDRAAEHDRIRSMDAATIVDVLFFQQLSQKALQLSRKTHGGWWV